MGSTEIVRINLKRLKEINAPYNPISGEGSFCVERTHVHIEDFPIKDMWLPNTFIETGFCQTIVKTGLRGYIQNILKISYSIDVANELYTQFCKERIKCDFEFWAVSCAWIRKKGGGGDIPFKLNRAQRKYLKKLEELRLASVPIDIILLKARQWGGSTLTQIYMLWIQLVLRKNWNSVICGAVENQSRIVIGMLDKVVIHYPSWASPDDNPVETKSFEGSLKTKIITNSGSLFSVGSMEKPDTLRSQDISMAHLTEVGVWKETKGKKPEDLIQSIFGSILEGPDTVKVIESTAKGTGNYFHRTWLDAVNGKNNFTPVFIAWFDIDIYQKKIGYANYYAFIKTMNDYEKHLFELGATLEAIAWYREKRKTIKDEWRMMSEYPSTPEEAFQSTGRRFFPINYVDMVRKTCIDPCFIGEFEADAQKGKKAFDGLHFVKAKNDVLTDNILFIWSLPDETTERYINRYIVSVDIGGVSDSADYSVITVADRLPMLEAGGVPEIVAQWHGHIEHDLLIWKAAQIAKAYGDALLVVESNTLETEGTEGDNFEYVLDEIVDFYPNLYSRTSAEQIKQGAPVRYGFHTNTSTKPMVINTLKAALRDSLYIERCIDTTFEMDVFEIKEDGKQTGAVEGNHDDRVMSTAILIYVCYNYPLPYKAAQAIPDAIKRKRKIVSEASF